MKIIIATVLALIVPSGPVFGSTGAAVAQFPLWSVVFFAALLLCIAGCPLVNSNWWGRRYGYVSMGLALPAAAIVIAEDWHLLAHVFSEYCSFIILLGSLFVISGGIVIRTGARGTPKLNAAVLLAGALFASLIGTTGASMVLIRPLIRANKWRRHVSHLYIFFIFIVSNIGGLLTPMGDPPLFLGFLRGVPFTWTFKLFPFWIFAVFMLVVIFFFLDNHIIKKEDREDALKGLNEMPLRKVVIRGRRNLLLLLAVIAALFVPPVYREGIMLLAAGLSIYMTPAVLREENAFTYHPIVEVALLFAGIFVTMVPVVKILEVRGNSLGITEPRQFFWASGLLSSFLDNAPTYLVFMTAAQSVAQAKGMVTGLIAGVPDIYLRALSVGCVFMGANTYIGNGPNFMVKAICEENEIEMPTFLGYMAWSACILIPLFLLMTAVFF